MLVHWACSSGLTPSNRWYVRLQLVTHLTIYSNGLAEVVHGSHRPDGIHGWRFPRSSCQFPFLLRSGEAQISSGTLAASSMAQGAGSHVTIHVQRLYATAVADCSTQECVCFARQTPFW